MHGDEPADLVHEVLAEALWPDHPLGVDVLGSEESIEGLNRQDIASFHAAHYRPANMVLAAAGDIAPDAVVAGIEARFAGRSGGASPIRQEPALPPTPLKVLRRATEQAHLTVGFQAFDRDDEDRYALAVLDHVLGGGMSSRLFQEIREERGLAYSVYSYRSLYQGTGALAVYAGTAPARAREVLGLIDDQLDGMVDGGITDRELAMAKTHLRGSLALALEDSGARMSRIGRGQLIHGWVPQLDEIDARLTAVTKEDVNRVVERVLTGTRVVAAVGPFLEDDFS